MSGTATAVAGTSNGATEQAAPAYGSAFGVPKYSTQRRIVPDAANNSLGAVPAAGAQVTVQATRLDQLDIVTAHKLVCTVGGTWTNTGAGLVVSPFFPANIFQQITYKLQAAYNTFNLTGPLAAIIQAYRPVWGAKGVAGAYPNTFCKLGLTAAKPTFGAAFTGKYSIDIPFALKFDEYFDLDGEGDPMTKQYDAIVSPMYMAAQARVVVPTITLAQQLSTSDLLGSPVSRPGTDTTSTYTVSSFSGQLIRDAYWTANNPAANPPQYPWIYTRDFVTQPTMGQNQVGVLIQNTGVSVGQVLSIWGFVWDPSAAAGLGGVVPYTSIASYELVTGGSLQNRLVTPQTMQDELQSHYGFYDSADTASWPSGIFVFDFAQEPDGGFLTNKNAINTYLVNGVQLNIKFNAGLIPGNASTVYMGVEALKLATS